MYRDPGLVVVDKPQGMAVHPSPGSWCDTLVQLLRKQFEDEGDPRPHIAPVSRLDRGTSGLVLFATDKSVHPGLHRQIVRREIRREYLCLVAGSPQFQETICDLPIGRHWEDIRKMAVYDLPLPQAEKWGARRACTHLTLLERYDGSALLRARLETGRMHQIRAHCQFLRLPVLGDKVYGGPLLPGHRWQFLHAFRLELRHPLTDDNLSFETSAPPEMARLVDRLRSGCSLDSILG